MKIIICIDKENGMLFNNRRQSQDKILRDKILELVGSNALWVNEYTAKQFESTDKLSICNDLFSKASDDDFCFIENVDIPVDTVQEFYIFNWNRLYPSDKYFEFDLKNLGFKRVKKEDFEGSSHNKITLEIYKRG